MRAAEKLKYGAEGWVRNVIGQNGSINDCTNIPFVSFSHKKALFGNMGLLTKYRFTIIYGIIYLGDEV